MSRRTVPWLIAIPLMVCGSVAAHELAYWIVVPDGDARTRLLASSGHDYFRYGPLLLGILAATLIVATGMRTLSAARGRRSAELASAWWFFALPPLGFAIQEHVERLLASGALPLDAAADPTFLVGVALQLPFALAALVLSRVLASAAVELGRTRAHPPRTRRFPVALTRPAYAPPALPRIPTLALGRSQRGPPAQLV